MSSNSRTKKGKGKASSLWKTTSSSSNSSRDYRSNKSNRHSSKRRGHRNEDSSDSGDDSHSNRQVSSHSLQKGLSEQDKQTIRSKFSAMNSMFQNKTCEVVVPGSQQPTIITIPPSVLSELVCALLIDKDKQELLGKVVCSKGYETERPGQIGRFRPAFLAWYTQQQFTLRVHHLATTIAIEVARLMGNLNIGFSDLPHPADVIFSKEGAKALLKNFKSDGAKRAFRHKIPLALTKQLTENLPSLADVIGGETDSSDDDDDAADSAADTAASAVDSSDDDKAKAKGKTSATAKQKKIKKKKKKSTTGAAQNSSTNVDDDDKPSPADLAAVASAQMQATIAKAVADSLKKMLPDVLPSTVSNAQGGGSSTRPQMSEAHLQIRSLIADQLKVMHTAQVMNSMSSDDTQENKKKQTDEEQMDAVWDHIKKASGRKDPVVPTDAPPPSSKVPVVPTPRSSRAVRTSTQNNSIGSAEKARKRKARTPPTSASRNKQKLDAQNLASKLEQSSLDLSSEALERIQDSFQRIVKEMATSAPAAAAESVDDNVTDETDDKFSWPPGLQKPPSSHPKYSALMKEVHVFLGKKNLKDAKTGTGKGDGLLTLCKLYSVDVAKGDLRPEIQAALADAITVTQLRSDTKDWDEFRQTGATAGTDDLQGY